MHLTIWSLYITVLDNRILCLRLILISDTVQLKVLETGDWVHIDRRKYKRQLRQFESALYRRISRIILLESDQNPATFLFVNTQKSLTVGEDEFNCLSVWHQSFQKELIRSVWFYGILLWPSTRDRIKIDVGNKPDDQYELWWIWYLLGDMSVLSTLPTAVQPLSRLPSHLSYALRPQHTQYHKYKTFMKIFLQGYKYFHISILQILFVLIRKFFF